MRSEIAWQTEFSPDMGVKVFQSIYLSLKGSLAVVGTGWP